MVTSIDEAKKVDTCPFGGGTCTALFCRGCNVLAKMQEDHEIAENLKDYWKHLQSGAEQC